MERTGIDTLHYLFYGHQPKPAVFYLCGGSFFAVQLIEAPADRILTDVSYVFFVILPVADNVIVKTALPNVFAVFFITKSFER